MIDMNRILDAFQNDPNARRTAMVGGGGLAAGLAASMLMGGSGRKMLGKAAKYGAVAASGGLAYHAWQKSRQNAGQPASGAAAPAAPQGRVPAIDADYEAAPANSGFLPAPSDETAQDALARTLLRAMIAAAKADGKIDAAEKERIFARLNTMDVSAGDKAFVFDELSAPLDLNAVVAGATSPEVAAEIYAASLVAIESETPAEKAYLNMLAIRLELDAGLVAEIHRMAGAAAPA
jgi:uncharacterized membrane protein YebE (DUF533 family)